MTIAWYTLMGDTTARQRGGQSGRLRELLAPGQDPASGRSRIGQEVLVGQQIIEGATDLPQPSLGVTT